VGSRPTAKVLTAMRIMVTASTFCRPTRSPSGPNTNPPSGRTTKAAAKVANVDTSWVPEEPEGKNTLPSVPAR